MRALVTEQTRIGLFTATFFAAMGVSVAFLPLWMADRGLSADEIGQVLALVSLLRILAVPAWGRAADTFGRGVLLLLAAGVAACAATVLGATHGFLPILLVAAVQGIASSAIVPLTDATTLALARAGRLEYGRARAWGSASYMLATAAAGPFLQWAGTAVVPAVLALGYGCTALLAPFLPDARAGGAGRDLRAADTRLLRLPAFRAGVLASALVQASHAAYYGFAALHWRQAGLSDTLIGLLIAEGIVAEVALFVWGRALVERLGPARLTAIAASCALVRWTATAYVTAPAALAGIQLLHAGTFAFQHLSTMQVLSRTVPPHRAGTAQALMSVLGGSLPMGVLTWVAGSLYGQMGGQVFLLMAASGGAAWLVVPALARALPRIR